MDQEQCWTWFRALGIRQETGDSMLLGAESLLDDTH
jgi:hypothetical protein